MIGDNAERSAPEHPLIREAIILAGGLGTRLRSAVPDLPKCMAPVAGKPFLSYVIDYLTMQGVERLIFALGHKSETIENFVRSKFAGSLTAGADRPVDAPPARNPGRPVDTLPTHNRDLSYEISLENEPLGTGGAIRLACTRADEDTVLVLNGDTFFGVHAGALASFHFRKQAHCSLCLKPMRNFDRYGVVELGPDGRVTRFLEKQFYREGLINGGVYALDVPRFLEGSLPGIFSFEKDWLETHYRDKPLYGLVQDGYFIDIGIPEDYERAQREADKLR